MESTLADIRKAGENHSFSAESAAAQNSALVRTILYITYIVIPIAAGADKFINLLADWKKYINPAFLSIIPLSGDVFMKIAGVIEIAAGILVLAKPKIGAYVVSLWLVLIALQLLAGWMYPDIAVRDIAMAAGAFCLARLNE